MKQLISILIVFFFMFSQVTYVLSSDEPGLFMPPKDSARETAVDSQKQQPPDKPKVFKTNFIFIEHSPPSQSESVGKKIFNALNLALSVVAIPFLFTGPTANTLSNYALNYPLVQHSGETIASAVKGTPENQTIFDTALTYEVNKSKPFIIFIPEKKECNWVVVENSDKKLLEFKERAKGWTSAGKRKGESFIFQVIDTGESIIHIGCITPSGEPLLTYTYKFKVSD